MSFYFKILKFYAFFMLKSVIVFFWGGGRSFWGAPWRAQIFFNLFAVKNDMGVRLARPNFFQSFYSKKWHGRAQIFFQSFCTKKWLNLFLNLFALNNDQTFVFNLFAVTNDMGARLARPNCFQSFCSKKWGRATERGAPISGRAKKKNNRNLSFCAIIT
jgi:hypothetical protein